MKLCTAVAARSDLARSVGGAVMFGGVVGLSMDSAQAPNMPQENARRPGCFNLATFPGFLIEEQTIAEPNFYEKFIFLVELFSPELLPQSLQSRI